MKRVLLLVLLLNVLVVFAAVPSPKSVFGEIEFENGSKVSKGTEVKIVNLDTEKEYTTETFGPKGNFYSQAIEGTSGNQIKVTINMDDYKTSIIESLKDQPTEINLKITIEDRKNYIEKTFTSFWERLLNLFFKK